MLLIFFVVLILLLFRKDTTDRYFSLEKSNALKAVFPIVIILHHVSQHKGCLQDFRMAGIYAVGLFFFISGYGLMCKSSLNWKSYRRRVVNLFLPLLLPIIIYLIILYLSDDVVVIDYLIDRLKYWDLVLPFSWFVVTIYIVYTFFYMSAILTNHIFVSTFLFLISFSVLMIILRAEPYLHMTTYCFLLGMLYKHNEIIILKLKTSMFRHMVILAFFVLSLLALFKQPFPGYSALAALVWTFCLVFLLSNVRIVNHRLLSHLKNISYEVYLSQGIAFYVLDVLNVDHIVIYITMVLFISFIIGHICFVLRTGFCAFLVSEKTNRI